MSSCSVCGAQIDSINGYRCNYCDELNCTDHRLPEQHRCPGVSRAARLGPDITPREPGPGDGKVVGAPDLKPGTGKVPEEIRDQTPPHTISVGGFLMRFLAVVAVVVILAATVMMFT